MQLTRAEGALHDRGRLAFAAAAAAGAGGEFRGFRDDGLRVLLTSAPGLGFLNSVTGVDQRSVRALPEVLDAFRAAGADQPTLVTAGVGPAVEDQLRGLGFAPAGTRPVAVLPSPVAAPTPPDGTGPAVTGVDSAADRALFRQVLLGGYAGSAELARFLAAEHSAAAVHCFLACQDDRPVAAAAMSVHEGVAVLGGAATLPDRRGSGAQTALLQHRLGAAADLGADLATATAAPDSPSVRNLARAGFAIHPRTGWRELGVQRPRAASRASNRG